MARPHGSAPGRDPGPTRSRRLAARHHRRRVPHRMSDVRARVGSPGSRLRPGAARVLSVAGFRAILRPPSARVTNQTLLVALLLVFGTGVATVATGSPSGRWAAVTHGVAGMAILLLIPCKSRVVRGGLRRARRTGWASLLTEKVGSSATRFAGIIATSDLLLLAKTRRVPTPLTASYRVQGLLVCPLSRRGDHPAG